MLEELDRCRPYYANMNKYRVAQTLGPKTRLSDKILQIFGAICDKELYYFLSKNSTVVLKILQRQPRADSENDTDYI